MRIGLICLLLAGFAVPAKAQEQLRCATRSIEPYINRQLDEQFGQKLTDAQRIELIGRGMDHRIRAVWKSASPLSEDAAGLRCSAVVQLTRPDTGVTFDVTVQYTLTRRDGGTYVKMNSASR